MYLEIFLADFAVFCGISLKYLNFTGPRPREISEALYMDWQVTPPKHVTSPNWGPSPPCKQALRFVSVNVLLVLSPVQNITHIFIRSSGPSLNLFMFVELAAVNHQGDKVQNRNSFYY